MRTSTLASGALKPEILNRWLMPLARLGRAKGKSSKHWQDEDVKLNLGVCVSGGPDSMALAFLLSKIKSIGGVHVDLLAIIVDHQARPSSNREALYVSSILRDLGIQSTILGLTWDKKIPPLDRTDFESRAREGRYQAIAEAALQSRIKHLFLAHHQDDQVETVLMRLISQQRVGLHALRGMSFTSSIPCCDGIPGAHETLTDPKHHPIPVSNQEIVHSALSPIDKDFGISLPGLGKESISISGGLQLHRPLLDFPKASLIATCVHNGVPFVVDHTNKDPTATTRNAIRFMRERHRLPLALSGDRILTLQRHAKAQFDNVLHWSDRFWNKMILERLMLTSGIVEVKLPFYKDFKPHERDGMSHALSRLFEAVTPAPRSEKSESLPTKLFNQFYPKSQDDDMTGDGPQKHHLIIDSTMNYRRVQIKMARNGERTWILSRQPMRASEIRENTWMWSSVTSQLPNNDLSDVKETPWKIWDNRFWIKLKVRDLEILKKLKICPLSESQLHSLKTNLRRHRPEIAQPAIEQLSQKLNSVAPGKIRYTLPVLLFEDQIVIFPTLPTITLPYIQEISLHSLPRPEFQTLVRYKACPGLGNLRISRHKKQFKSSTDNITKVSDIIGPSGPELMI